MSKKKVKAESSSNGAQKVAKAEASKADASSKPDPKQHRPDVKGKGKASNAEIDDIFGTSKPSVVSKAGDALETAANNVSKSQLKKRKRDEAAPAAQIVKKEQAKPKPVTIVDGSDQQAKKAKANDNVARLKKAKSAEQAAKDKEDDEIFRDSRGTSNRRKTDDGLDIYDINELGIGKGGDTELCPFDCPCCF